MKVGIYNEPAGGSIGGSEVMAAVLAEALKDSHQVDIVHHRYALTAEQLAKLSDTDLNSVRLRYVAPDHEQFSGIYNPWRRYRIAQMWHASLSEPYDLFISLSHGLPPFCHAPRGALIVLFPFFTLPYIQPRGGILSNRRLPLRRRLARPYHKLEWKKRMGGYQVKAAISHFTRDWAQRRWDIECHVVHPPVDNHFRNVEKTNTILSVGRFAIKGEGHTKNQLEMLTAFRQMTSAGLQGWDYFCVGGLYDSPNHRAYFDKLRRVSAECRAHVIANIERAELKGLYEQTKIFWHAAGFGENEEARPELAEHFGISTVEALAAGCVPIAINKGGQREIIEHGVNGFLWNTLEELKEYTRMVMGDEQLRVRMSEAARLRAKFFSREEFISKFMKLLLPLLT